MEKVNSHLLLQRKSVQMEMLSLLHLKPNKGGQLNKNIPFYFINEFFFKISKCFTVNSENFNIASIFLSGTLYICQLGNVSFYLSINV